MDKCARCNLNSGKWLFVVLQLGGGGVHDAIPLVDNLAYDTMLGLEVAPRLVVGLRPVEVHGRPGVGVDLDETIPATPFGIERG